jgi:hypothetical protein
VCALEARDGWRRSLKYPLDPAGRAARRRR